jgi:hypothetical protein
LFVDPYHKQIYQQPLDVTLASSGTTAGAPSRTRRAANSSSDSSSPAEVRGVPVPDLDFPTSVDVDRQLGEVYWIDSKTNAIGASDVAEMKQRLVYQAPSGKCQLLIGLQSCFEMTVGGVIAQCNISHCTDERWKNESSFDRKFEWV